MKKLQYSINDRALAVLKRVVERYIIEGQPVGSKVLAEENAGGMALSPATLRHVMADLEEAGYLHSPHPSAGRVPTVHGYRLFINQLLQIQPLEQSLVQTMQSQLTTATESAVLVENASRMLAGITQLAGVVTLPKREHFILRHIEFLPLSDQRILAVLVLNDCEIQNRIIYSDRPYTRAELQQAGNYLTATYAGKEWLTIRQEMAQQFQQDRQSMQASLKNSLDLVEQAFNDEAGGDYLLAGESNLLLLAEQAGMHKLRDLFSTLSQKRTILDLLDACLRTEGVQIFIGQESGYAVFDECSIITAPYSVDGKVLGVLGVIGPTRIAYERIIPAVDVTAKLLSAALEAH